MSTSAFPIFFKALMHCTPMADPHNPPTSSRQPILMSTFLKRKWAATPDEDVATMALVSEAAATVGGTPIIIRMGVSRNPPPTPSRPESTPTRPPAAIRRKTLILIPAIGKRIRMECASQPRSRKQDCQRRCEWKETAVVPRQKPWRGLPIRLERVRGALRRRLGLGGVGFELIRKTGFATCDAPDTHGSSLP